MTPEDKLAIRKRVKAWSDESRKRTDRQNDAAEERYRAFYEARLAGIPLDTIAHDAGVDRSFVSRKATEYARRNDLPVISGPRHASRIEKESA